MNKFVSTSMESITMRAAMTSMLMPACALAAILVGSLDCPVKGQVSVATSKNTKPLAPRKAPPANMQAVAVPISVPLLKRRLKWLEEQEKYHHRQSLRADRSPVAAAANAPMQPSTIPPAAQTLPPSLGLQLATASAVEMQLFHSFDDGAFLAGTMPTEAEPSIAVRKNGESI